jgi:hypothetical protein
MELEKCNYCGATAMFLSDFCPNCQKSRVDGSLDPKFTKSTEKTTFTSPDLKSRDSQGQEKSNQGGMNIQGWGKIGGFVGIAIMFLFFREKPHGPEYMFSLFVKGAIAGGVGAALFAGLGLLLGAKK